ncbi:MAG: iron ABC transporter permease [Burkholderiales bacterium]|nr:iron ABC transporter permease [Burkholderiales bacterium]
MNGALPLRAASLRLQGLLGFWPLATLAVFALITALLVYPVLKVVALSFSAKEEAAGVVANYVTFFTNPYYYQTLINSFKVSIGATIGAVLVGVPAAYFVARYRIWGRTFVRAAVVMVFVSPPFIGTYSWVILFGRSGIVSGWFADIGIQLPSIYGAQGIIFVFILQFFPFVFLMMSAAMRTIDQSVEDAARNLGSSELRSFFTVLLPLLVPSISTGALLVFVAAFSELGTPILLGERFRVLSVLIYSEFVNEFGGEPIVGSTLAVLMITVTVLALALQRYIAHRHTHPATTINPLAPMEQPKAKRIAATAFVFGLTGLSILPILNVVVSAFLKANGPMLLPEFSLDSFRAILPRLWVPLSNTVLFTTVATLLCALVGVIVGYIVVRRSGVLASTLDSLIMLSFAVPGVVLGVGLVAAYHEPPIALTGTGLILILAYFVRRLPFSVRSSVSMLHQISRDTEYASLNLGAGPARTFAKSTVPLVAVAVVSGALLTWSNTIRELNTTLMLQSGPNVTMSIEIFNEVVNANLGTASAFGAVLIVLNFLPLAILFWGLGKREDMLA